MLRSGPRLRSLYLGGILAGVDSARSFDTGVVLSVGPLGSCFHVGSCSHGRYRRLTVAQLLHVTQTLLVILLHLAMTTLTIKDHTLRVPLSHDTFNAAASHFKHGGDLHQCWDLHRRGFPDSEAPGL